MSSKLRKRLFYFIVCPIFFGGMCLISCYLTFPYDDLRNYITGQFNANLGPQYTMQVVDLQPSWVTGVTMEGVTITSKSDDPTMPDGIVTFQEINARLSLLPLLSGEQHITFDAEGMGGSMTGEASLSSTSRHLNAELTNLNLRQADVLRTLAGFPIRGTVSGRINVTLVKEGEGMNSDTDLRISGVALGPGKVKIGALTGGLSFDEVNAGDLHLTMRGTNSWDIECENANGEDAELGVEGAMTPHFIFPRSNLNVTVRVKPKEAYFEKTDVTRRLGAALQMAGRRARDTDGSYVFRLQGVVNQPRFRPGAGSTTSRRERGRGSMR